MLSWLPSTPAQEIQFGSLPTVFLELIVNILQIKDQDLPVANGPNGKTG